MGYQIVCIYVQYMHFYVYMCICQTSHIRFPNEKKKDHKDIKGGHIIYINFEFE